MRTALPLMAVIVLVSGGGALAAEPIVVEPESAESVKSCDKYGEGFVYIPDSDTCVRISGEVRTTYTHSTVKHD